MEKLSSKAADGASMYSWRSSSLSSIPQDRVGRNHGAY